MTTPRPYRDQISHDDALAEMKRCAGTQFDPQIVSLIDQILHGGMDIHPEDHKTERSPLSATVEKNLEDEEGDFENSAHSMEDVMGVDDLEEIAETEGAEANA